MGISIEIADKALKKILNNTDFTHPAELRISLHTDDPGETGENEVEVGTSDYERKEPALGVVADMEVTTSADLEWENMPACTIKYACLWDNEATPGFWWVSNELSPNKEVGEGDTFILPAGEVTWTLT